MSEEGKVKYDWTELKKDYLSSSEAEVSVFLRAKLGLNTIDNGWAREQTKGWADEKKDMQRAAMQRAREMAEIELAEKLKISFSDLLLSKKLIFSVDSRYLEIMGKLAQSKPEKPITLTNEEIVFLKVYSDSLGRVWERVQVELGLPTNVQKMGLMGEDNIAKLTVEIVKNKNENTGIQNKGDGSV